MAIIQRSPEYRKQRRTTFLTNTARVRKQLTGVSAVSGVHEPALQIISPTISTVILPGISASASAGNTGVTVTGGAQSGLAVFEDDFSSYTDSADWRTDPNNWYLGLTNASTHFIDTSITDPEVGSAQSLRLDYLPGFCGGLSLDLLVDTFQDGRVMADISPDLTELWVEMRMRFDDAWNTNDTGGCPEQESHTLLSLIVGAQGQAPFFQLRDGVTADSFYAITAPPDNAGQSQAEFAQGSLADSDNTWHVIRAHCKISETTKTIPDGLMSFEIDGERIVGNTTGFDGTDIITAAVDPLGSGDTYNNFVMVAFSGGLKPLKAVPAQKLWISRIRIFDQDPGWTVNLPNLPEGAWTDSVDRPFDADFESNFSDGSIWRNGRVVYTPGDGTNPQSSISFARITYPIGLLNGTAPTNNNLNWSAISTGADPITEIYWAYWFRISANFWANNTNKFGFFHNHQSDGDIKPSAFPTVQGVDDGALRLVFKMQNTTGDPNAGGGGARNLEANVTSAPIVRDRWYFMETHLKLNVPGTANGIVRQWLDGSQKLEYTNVSWDDGTGGGTVVRFNNFTLNPTWGGGPNDTNPVRSHWDIDHTVFKIR